MARCWGIKGNLRLCKRIGDWNLFCHDHKWQLIGWLSSLAFTVAVGILINYLSSVTLPKDPLIAESLQALKAQLTTANVREQEYQDQISALTNAVNALAKQEGPGIDEALQLLAQGDTTAAEAIFQKVANRKKADIQEAAVAYRHLGALAFLHDTQKALNAYRRATELDPNNAEGWNQLGHLLRRTGQLEDAKATYQRVIALGEKRNNLSWIATAYGNLGNLYQIRGELEQAEAMYRKSLGIDEALSNKEGMATNYGNLGAIHQIRGELEQAEAMHRKSLGINEALSNKEGIASNYGNLGNLYQIRGELGQAEAMYRKSLTIYETLGHKEKTTISYGNLSAIYAKRGELEQAEAMYRKSLGINEALSNKEGMATNYGNLGAIHQIRGELEQAKAMYHISLEIRMYHKSLTIEKALNHYLLQPGHHLRNPQ